MTNNFDHATFLSAIKDAEPSEQLVFQYLNEHDMWVETSYTMTPKAEQKAGVRNGWHIADITTEGDIAIEVKEDKASGRTGNLCFEASCLKRLSRWAIANDKSETYVAYINHRDYGLDIFRLSELMAELKYLTKIGDARRIKGGDQHHALYLVPLSRVRTMSSNYYCCIGDAQWEAFQNDAVQLLNPERRYAYD
tara:strand:- start:1005 stop:1586 length:582 start_codon:yes stop_codon:yes gene_type:complete